MRRHTDQSTTVLYSKLDMAEEALEYSNRNIELTIEILIHGPDEVRPLLLERAENSARISRLVQNIKDQIESDKEKELLDAADVHSSSVHNYAQSLQHMIDRQTRAESGRAMANVMLPLLLDNASWRAFVHFLRAQGESAEPEKQVNRALVPVSEFVRGNQELKSALAERKRIAEKLSQLASIIECSNDAIVTHTLDGKIVSWNIGAENIYGYSPSEVLGEPRNILLPCGQSDELPTIVETLMRGESAQPYETVHVRKDGQRIDVSMMISPVKDVSENIVGAVAVTRDITDRKALEAQLRQSQKMESIGRLSGGIAHDFNNLLSVIIGYSGVIEERLDDDNESFKGIQEIKKAGQRAAGLTRQLLAFSRQQVLEPRVLNLNSVVADIGKMLLRLIGEDIELSTRLQPELGRAKADQGQIEQVIVNLVVNARDAMPSGGKLVIETRNVEINENDSAQHLPPIPGGYIELTVTDTGVGMDKVTQSHIFEPFFTTKEKDKGTGLGLSVVYGVVKQSGGHIWVDSEPGRGTSFRICLPRVEEALEKGNRPTPLGKPCKGSETLLLVEDEESLRELTRSLLVQSGYSVLVASEGDKALEIAREHRGSIHLLLTDVVLPGISGNVLAEKVSKQYPEVKVLFMSGYPANAVSAQGILEEGTFLLHKPFEPQALRNKVREVLDGAGKLNKRATHTGAAQDKSLYEEPKTEHLQPHQT